jgi:hypothetical protein
MDIEVHSFPTMRNPEQVERTYCELVNKYRNGEHLDPEVLDWMDSANNWLMASGSKL